MFAWFFLACSVDARLLLDRPPQPASGNPHARGSVGSTMGDAWAFDGRCHVMKPHECKMEFLVTSPFGSFPQPHDGTWATKNCRSTSCWELNFGDYVSGPNDSRHNHFIIPLTCVCVPHSTIAIISQTTSAVRLRGSGAPILNQKINEPANFFDDGAQ